MNKKLGLNKIVYLFLFFFAISTNPIVAQEITIIDFLQNPGSFNRLLLELQSSGLDSLLIKKNLRE